MIAPKEDSSYSKIKDASLLNNRQRAVLKSVCDSYISTGIPVGSRTISKISGFFCSPATIRNEMADLESMGFLFSPHTSAGRIPTEKGYRFYVNFLLKFEQLSQMEESLIGVLAQKFEEEIFEQDKIIKKAIRLASDMTNLAGIGLIPQKSQKKLKSMQLIRLFEDRTLFVMVDECGQVSDEVVMIPPETTDDELQQLTNFLNAEICNHKVQEIDAILLRKSHKLIIQFNSLLSTLTKKIKAAIQNPGDEAVFLEGLVNFFEQNEFKDAEKMKKMVQLLDQKEALLNLLAKSLENSEEIMVNIGSDSGLAMNDLSIVTAKYRGPNDSYGRIGLIGPLRMHYGRVVATLANISKTLNRLFLGRQASDGSGSSPDKIDSEGKK